MSKVFLKSLLVSPALLGAVLMASGSAVAEVAASTQGNVSTESASLAPVSVQPEAVQSGALEFSTQTEVIPAEKEAKPAEVAKPVALTPIQPESSATSSSQTSVAQLDRLNQYSSEGRSNVQGQIRSVSDLSDVSPTDWAYQSLQSLVERYGCIVGYPDRTYRGNRALSRYEFAAGLNACLDRVNELIAQGTAGLVTKEDLAVLQRLQEEFAAELATLRGRVDALEARTATLEAQQFSTTTKLSGEAIFAITDNFGGDGNGVPSSNTVFVNRVRLNLLTSFTGEDVLWTRLQTGNSTGSLSGDNQGTQTFDLGSGGTNFILDTLIYTFPVGDKLTLSVEANAGYWPDLVPTLNPFFEDFDGGQGSLSTFAQRSPIYRVVDGTGYGLLFKYDFTDSFSFSGGYMADGAGNLPGPDQGLFNGSFGAMAQLSYETGKFGAGLTYVRGYFVGNAPFGVVGTVTPFARYESNNFGFQGYYKFSPKFSLSGWFMYSDINSLTGVAANADVYSYALGMAFPDLGGKGNLGGLFFGAQPYVANTNLSTPFHIEAFYRFQLTDNISITPGVIWLTAPGNRNRLADDGIIGTVRTTFIF